MIAEALQIELLTELCPATDTCKMQWRVAPDGIHYFLYILETNSLYKISTDSTLTSYDLSNIPYTQSAIFDFEAISDNTILFFDSASSKLHEYNLSTQTTYEYASEHWFTSCSRATIYYRSRSIMKPILSDRMVICGVDGDSRFIATSNLQLTDVTIQTFIHFPHIQQNIHPWREVIMSTSGNIYAIFEVPAVDNYPSSFDKETLILSKWIEDASIWHFVEIPIAQFPNRAVGHLVGVDENENSYFYSPNEFIARVNSDGKVIDILTSEDLGEYHDFIGIHPDGSISFAQYEQPFSTIGLTIKTVKPQ